MLLGTKKTIFADIMRIKLVISIINISLTEIIEGVRVVKK